MVCLVLAGAPVVADLFRRILNREFGSDLLAGVSIVASASMQDYLPGMIVVLMLSGGAALEEYSRRRASSVLEALARRTPRTAHRRASSGFEDIDASDIAVGDTLILFPYELCPADASVTEGQGSVDESYLTGEPFQINKARGSEVLSGALNGGSALTIQVTRKPADSRYARIVRVMREAESARPPMRRIADRLGALYTPLALAIAAAGWIVSGHPRTFLAVTVIATPCPLLLAIPVAIISAVSLAASRGIVIRNPAALELLNTCRTVIFDKTGTLTYGKPALADLVCAPGEKREEVLRAAASLEQYSRHPLASAILEAAREEHLSLSDVLRLTEDPGKGMCGVIGGSVLQLGGRDGIAGLPPAASGPECILLRDGQYAALFRFRDEPRTESPAFVSHLAPQHHFERFILLSGDREPEVRYLAGKVGITIALFGKSPEQKVEIVRQETARAATLFIGDGINDAPAMQAATVGVAFGSRNEITSEAADAVVLEPSLAKVDELIHMGRRMRSIALQSAIGGMALSIAGMLAAAAGYLPPVAGAVAQEVIDAAAVLNALRMIVPVRKIRSDI